MVVFSFFLTHRKLTSVAYRLQAAEAKANQASNKIRAASAKSERSSKGEEEEEEEEDPIKEATTAFWEAIEQDKAKREKMKAKKAAEKERALEAAKNDEGAEAAEGDE